MASKRKSTIPCMIPLKNLHLQNEIKPNGLSTPTEDIAFSFREDKKSKTSQSVDETPRQEAGYSLKDNGFYTCRLCNFEMQDLNLFLDHVYSRHPDFRTDPCFICVDCDARAAKFEGLALHNAHVHPSTMTTMLQLIRKDSRIIVEQRLCFKSCEGNSFKDTEISITKTPIMRMLKGKTEPKRIVVSQNSSDDHLTSAKMLEKNYSPPLTVTHVPTIVNNGGASKVTLPSTIQIVNDSGALPLLKPAVTQVVSVVQNKSINQYSAPVTISSHSSASNAKNLPKVMIPLSSIPIYNTSMDSSSFLKTSFSKFPYPTKAELCYLTVVTKYPEEQIKIWFTAQRLKQGISWSPEEIEDARRKMFNTIIQATPSNGQQQCQINHTTPQPTITVLGSTGIPQILQGSLVGQGGVIVSHPIMTNGIQVSSAPVTIAVTPKPQAASKPLMQARPTAALVADKGISMVIGSIGSSSSGRSTARTSSASRSIGTTSDICSQTSVINLAGSSKVKSNVKRIAESNTTKLNSDSSNEFSTEVSNDACVQSNDTIVKAEVKGSSKTKADVTNKKISNTSPTTPTTDSPIPTKSESPSPVLSSSHATSSNNSQDAAKTKKSQEQLSALKDSFIVSQFPNQEEVDRLIRLTGLSVREVRKWFSDRRYHLKNLKGSKLSGQGLLVSGSDSQMDTLNAIDQPESMISSESPKTPRQSPLSSSQSSQRRSHRPPSPDFTAIRYKEREPCQVRALEASFDSDPFPSSEEVDRLRGETKMTRREIHGWFAERRRRVAAKKKKEEAEMAGINEGNVMEEEGETEMKNREKSNETNEVEGGNEEQIEDIELKVNPIKINLKMLKVTERHGEGEGSHRLEDSSPFRGKKTPEQLHQLKQVFARTHWPTSPQYNELIAKTGLPRPEVVRWFGDSRYVFKNGMLKWLESYQAMVDEEDFQKGGMSILKEHLDAHGKLDENQLEEVVKSSGLGEESIRRWFAQNTPALLEERTFEKAGGAQAGACATPAEASSASQIPDNEEVVVEQSGTSRISPTQIPNTSKETADVTSSNKQESD